MTRVALVTGASKGIGLACANELRGQGLVTVASSRREIDQDMSPSVRCDVTDRSSIEAAFSTIEERWGSVDVLVVNAGIFDGGPFAATSERVVRDVFETNVIGAMAVARRAVRGMVNGKWGRLIFIGSVAPFIGVAYGSAYAASKAALVGAARSLARELGPFGITANVVLPGYVDTDLTRETPALHEAAKLTPLRRSGDSREVAAVVSFLATEAAGYVTGALIPVDGGLSMGLG